MPEPIHFSSHPAVRETLESPDILAEIAARVPADTIAAMTAVSRTMRTAMTTALAGRRTFPGRVAEAGSDHHRVARMVISGKARSDDAPTLKRLLNDPDALALGPEREHLDRDLFIFLSRVRTFHDYVKSNPDLLATGDDLIDEQRIQIGFDLLHHNTSPERLAEIASRDDLTKAERTAFALHPYHSDESMQSALRDGFTPAELERFATYPHASDALLHEIALNPATNVMVVAAHPNAQDRTLYWAMDASTTADERAALYEHKNFGPLSLGNAASRAEGSQEIAFIRDHQHATENSMEILIAHAENDADVLPIVEHKLTPLTACVFKAHNNPSTNVKLALLERAKVISDSVSLHHELIAILTRNSLDDPAVREALREYPQTKDTTLQYLLDHSPDAMERAALLRLLAASSHRTEPSRLEALVRSARSPVERSRLAGNSRTPLKALRLLEKDATLQTLIGITKNPNADASLLTAIWAKPNAAANREIHYHLAHHMNTPPHILDAVAKIKPLTPDTLDRLVVNEALSSAALMDLARNTPFHIAGDIAGAHLQAMYNHKNADTAVRAEITRRLNDGS